MKFRIHFGTNGEGNSFVVEADTIEKLREQIDKELVKHEGVLIREVRPYEQQ